MSEQLVFSLKFAAIGIAIVFAALTVIVFAISIISTADRYFAERRVTASKKTAPVSRNIDDITLVLISAAVATLLHGRFHIKRVRRFLPGEHIGSSWSSQGRAVLHGSHVIKK